MNKDKPPARTPVALIDDGSIAMQGAIRVLQNSTSCVLASVTSRLENLSPPDPTPQGRRIVVVVDPFSGRGAAGDLLEKLAGSAGVLIMSASVDVPDVQAAVRAGVHGYIGKDSSASTLLAAIRAVASGGFYLPAPLSRALVQEPAPAAPDVIDAGHALSSREHEVLTLIALGLTHKQIGTRLGVAKATVDTYVQRIRQKLNVRNKADLTRLAMELKSLSAMENQDTRPSSRRTTLVSAPLGTSIPPVSTQTSKNSNHPAA